MGLLGFTNARLFLTASELRWSEPFACSGRYEGEVTGRVEIEDEQAVVTIDTFVARMRAVVDELSFNEQRQVLLSIRAISGEIADRLEAPSSRNHSFCRCHLS